MTETFDGMLDVDYNQGNGRLKLSIRPPDTILFDTRPVLFTGTHSGVILSRDETERLLTHLSGLKKEPFVPLSYTEMDKEPFLGRGLGGHANDVIPMPPELRAEEVENLLMYDTTRKQPRAVENNRRVITNAIRAAEASVLVEHDRKYHDVSS